MMRRMGTISALVALLLVPAIPVSAAEECNLTGQSTQAVLPGVVLTWDSSFHCRNAPDRGEYSITVVVFNATTSTESVTIDSLVLSHTTPRPRRGQAPEATAEASGLPIMVEPGESESFDVTGTYELVRTDEGKKANLHLLAYGVGDESGELFQLGINVHIRAPGVAD